MATRESSKGSCNHNRCSATYKMDHWRQKRAQTRGWFLQRNGLSWCPKHNPPLGLSHGELRWFLLKEDDV